MGCESSQFSTDVQPGEAPREQIDQMISSAKSIGDRSFSRVEQMADQFFKEKKIVEAIQLYQKMI